MGMVGCKRSSDAAYQGRRKGEGEEGRSASKYGGNGDTWQIETRWGARQRAFVVFSVRSCCSEKY
jgi:hypothetical protein